MAITGSGPRRVLRLCSVFEPPTVGLAPAVQSAFDPIGGMQNHTAGLTRALDRAGLRQTVITSRLGGPPSDTIFGTRSRILRVGLHVRWLRQLWAAAAYLRLGSVGQYDLVHVHQGEDLAALPLGIAAARRSGCPLVVTLHCSVQLTLRGSGVRSALMRVVGGPVETACLRRAERIIALTDVTADRLGDLRRHTVTIPSGVDAQSFDGSHTRLLENIPRPIVLYLGRLALQKDVPTLIRAFGAMTVAASLVVIGDGPDRPRVDRAIAQLPTGRRLKVHRLGFRPHAEVPGLLAAADVLVLPSIYEEMGSVLAEALHAGLPVVATRVGGIPTIVEDGTTGVLVPPSDPGALARAISGLLAQPDRLAEMGRASRARAHRYDFDVLADAVMQTYRVAMERARQ